jgi:CheY-like chemotaxis protein
MTTLDDRKKAQNSEASGFLLKPVDRSRLTGLIATLNQDFGNPEPPRPTQEAPPATAPAPADPSSPILLVEDDPTNRQILARMLRKHGLPVVEVGDGKAALDCVRETPPSLIILDLMLPVMDGLTFVQHLHSVPAHRSIPIIVLTAKDLTTEDRRRMGESVRKILQKGSCKREDILSEVTRSRTAS